jgi:hypothetical protein
MFFSRGVTLLSHPSQACLILQSISIMVIQQHIITNHYELLSFDTSSLRPKTKTMKNHRVILVMVIQQHIIINH